MILYLYESGDFMLKSMTGFGTHKVSNEDYEIKIDIKSVNNRYLDIQIKCPKSMIFLEDEIKRTISNYASRGKIDIFIDLKYLSKNTYDFKINKDLAETYISNLREIDSLLGSNSNYSSLDLVRFDSNLMIIDKVNLNEDKSFIELCLNCVNSSSRKFLEMKEQEGYNIQYDLNSKLVELKTIVDRIESLSSNVVKENINSLKVRIKDFLQSEDVSLNQDRLVNEIVFYSDKLSIDEELVRLNSHIKLLKDILNKEESNGKKMDFIIQELNRETNTIGSKSNNSQITNEVIDMKSIIEKMREQVQNIE